MNLNTAHLEESRAVTLRLTQAQAEALRSVGRALRSRKSWWGESIESSDPEESGRTAIRVEQRLDDKYEIVVYNAVGVIGLPDLQLVVMPKIPMSHLLYLLGFSSELPAKSTHEIVSVGNDTNLFELVAGWFLDATDKLLRLGLDRDYERRTADLAVVRGRVGIVPTMRAIHAGRPRVRCEFDRFTHDTSLNRTLKAAARAVSGAVALPITLRFRGRRVAERLDAAGELRQQDIHAVPDRHRPHYRDAHQLAVLILNSTAIEVSEGSRAARTFLLRTPDAVEQGIRCALNRHLPQGLTVKRGGRGLIAGDINGSKKRRVTPDIVFSMDKAVGDVKYIYTNGSVSTTNLYQVTTFATAYGAKWAAVIGFGRESVDATVQVGVVRVRGFRWNVTEPNPECAASQLAIDVAEWLN